jgi:hypothetical protein
VHHAYRIIERIVVGNEPRVTGAFEHAYKFSKLDILLNGDDVGARNHDVSDTPLAQTQDVPEHPAFFGREAGFARAHGIEDILEVSAGSMRLPAEQCAHRAHEPILLLCGRYRNRQIARFKWRAAGRTRAGWVAVRHGVSGVAKIAHDIRIGHVQARHDLAFESFHLVGLPIGLVIVPAQMEKTVDREMG